MSRLLTSESIEGIAFWNVNNPIEVGAIVGEGTAFEGNELDYSDAQDTLPFVLLYHGKWIFNKSTNKAYQVIDDGSGGYLVQERLFNLDNNGIVALLNANESLANMVLANRINWDTTNEDTLKSIVEGIITDLGDIDTDGYDAHLALGDGAHGITQFNLYASRFIVDAATPNLTTYTISGIFDPIHLNVNRLVYRGIESTDFEDYAAIFDFRYQHNEETDTTTIYTNPAFDPRLTFNSGDIIDILYSDNPVTFKEDV